jgi:hypothetical protein
VDMLQRLSTLLALAFLANAAAFGGETQVSSPDLWKIQKIYVGDMGQSDEAARFRLLLEDQLAKNKFTVVSQPGDAEATLTGILAVRVYANTATARATVRLKSPSGEPLWAGDFEPLRHYSGTKDPVQLHAEYVASYLRADSNKTAKKAHQPKVK